MLTVGDGGRVRAGHKLDHRASVTQFSGLNYIRPLLLTQKFTNLPHSFPHYHKRAGFPHCQEFQFTEHTQGVLFVSIKSLSTSKQYFLKLRKNKDQKSREHNGDEISFRNQS